MRLNLLFFYIFLLLSHKLKAQDLPIFSLFYEVEDYDRYAMNDHRMILDSNVSMIPFYQDGLFGLVEKFNPNQWIIQPQFNHIETVYPEGAVVETENGFGLMNDKEEWMILPYQDQIYKRHHIFQACAEYSSSEDDFHIPSEYRNCMHNTFYTATGEVIFKQKAHAQNCFTESDTLAWFRFGTDYTIRGLSGEVYQTFKVNKYTTFLGISNNILVFSTNQDRVTLYSGYDCHNNLMFEFKSERTLDMVYQLSDKLYGATIFGGYTYDNYLFLNQYGQIKDYYTYGQQSNKRTYLIKYSGRQYKLSKRINTTDFFNREYFFVNYKDKSEGVIDRNGDTPFGPGYDRLIGNPNHMIYFEENTESGFIDINGDTLIPKTYPSLKKPLIRALLLNTNLAKDSLGILTKDYFLSETKLGNLDSLLIEVLTTVDQTKLYKYNLKQSCIINTSLDIVECLSHDIAFVGLFSEGLAPAVNHKGLLGVIDQHGNWTIDPFLKFDIKNPSVLNYIGLMKNNLQSICFKNGLAFLGEDYGYLDIKGNYYPFGSTKTNKD